MSFGNTRVTGYLACRLEPAAEVFSEKLLRLGIEVKLGFRPPLAMSLILVQDVLDRLIRLPHGGHHLLALGSFDAYVIGAVHDE